VSAEKEMEKRNREECGLTLSKTVLRQYKACTFTPVSLFLQASLQMHGIIFVNQVVGSIIRFTFSLHKVHISCVFSKAWFLSKALVIRPSSICC
jgi:hypothetical protein